MKDNALHTMLISRLVRRPRLHLHMSHSQNVLPVPTPVIMPVLNECKASRTEKRERGGTDEVNARAKPNAIKVCRVGRNVCI